MEKCVICKSKTINVYEDTELPVCSPCDGKWGNKLKDKIESLDLKKEYIEMLKPTQSEEPFKASVSYSGGTKQDVINMIVGLMDSADVTIEELEENRF